MSNDHCPASIFNHVIGPVMAGPSSSHTAGPARIGKLAGQLLAEPLLLAEIAFEPTGSFAATYRGQKSDHGFVGGLMGWEPGDERLPQAFAEAAGRGIQVDFIIREFATDHPNTARISLRGKGGETCELTATSVGGGMVEIINIEGFPVSIAGDYFETLIFLPGGGAKEAKNVGGILSQNGVQLEGLVCIPGGNGSLIQLKTGARVPAGVIDLIHKNTGALKVRQLDPVLPVVSSGSCAVPFTTAGEMLDLISSEKIPLWQAAAVYESARSGWPEARVLQQMEQIRQVMLKSIQHGLEDEFVMPGYLGRSAKKITEKLAGRKHIPTGILDLATPRALAVMEANSAMGVVVAAPTAGSCGIIPSALFSAAEQMAADEEDQVKALLVAGIIGVIISEQATFAAEICGCQAECGASSSMAAAALVSLAGGTAEEAVNAASIALQNLLGLICDPVGAMVQIPCFNRNVMGAANAAVSANLALGGFDPVIPFDQVVQAMYRSGQMLPRELRCTGLGGLCDTKRGRELRK